MADTVLTQATFLDPAGVASLSTQLLKTVNLKLNDRIVSTLDASSDAYHVLAASALFALLGAVDSADTATINGKIKALNDLVKTNATATAGDGSVFGEIKKILAEIGTDADAATVESVYGSIAALNAKVDAFAHLQIQTYVGNIEEMTEPDSSKLYFVKTNAEDKTWELYVYNVTGETTAEWINVGDTSVDLANYYKHGDLVPITDTKIEELVSASYTATADPTAVPGAGA